MDCQGHTDAHEERRLTSVLGSNRCASVDQIDAKVETERCQNTQCYMVMVAKEGLIVNSRQVVTMLWVICVYVFCFGWHGTVWLYEWAWLMA